MSFIACSLTAHTPLIHFENHAEATLRGSELKPKFDKFLIQRGFGDLAKEAESGKRYFDYRVTIKPSKILLRKKIKPAKRANIPLFFGNMGDEYKKHPKYFVSSDVEVKFFSWNKVLIDLIEVEFPKFLASTNFGTRSSKGYGSFFIKERAFDPNLIEADHIYKIQIAAKKHPNELKELDIFYKFLRSGFNLKDQNGETTLYAKPVIFAYAKRERMTWEKRAIKQHCFEDDLQIQLNVHPNSDALKEWGEEYIIRDLLGLSTEQQWMSYGVSVKKEHPHIKRFKSPIIFKPIKNGKGYDVYFWVEKRSEERLEEFLDETFTIRAGSCSFELSTPPEFDMEDFLAYLLKIDLHNLIPDQYQNYSTAKTLKKIFKTLQRLR